MPVVQGPPLSGTDPSPWSAPSVAARVRAHEPRRATTPLGSLRPSAVLVPLIRRGDDVEVLLTLRPRRLGVHGGQVSFPGGGVDFDDADRWATALREAQEEVGLDEDQIERVGVLDDYRTVTGYHVTPCVAFVSPRARLVPSPAEVEELFTVPLARFFDPQHRRTMLLQRAGERRRLTFFLNDHHTVWGATAAMLTELLRVLGDR